MLYFFSLTNYQYFFFLKTPLDQFDLKVFSGYSRFFFSLLLVVLLTNIYILKSLSGNSSKKGVKKESFNLLTLILTDTYKTNFKCARYFHKIILSFLFFSILVFNMTGLLPFNYTLTSALCITFFLAGSYFFFITIITCLKYEWNNFAIIVPEKNIFWISPFLSIIEIISYFSKLLSLSLRLFANMVAGHALLKILGSFFLILFPLAFISGFLIPLSLLWLTLIILFILESFLAFLQSYVFTLLITIYLRDTTENAH